MCENWRKSGEIFRRYFGDIMEILWRYYGDIMEILWRYFGDIMEILWRYYGDIMEILWRYFGDIMEIFWRYYSPCCHQKQGREQGQGLGDFHLRHRTQPVHRTCEKKCKVTKNKKLTATSERATASRTGITFEVTSSRGVERGEALTGSDMLFITVSGVI